MALVDHQGVAVLAMPLQVRVIERQVIVCVFKFHRIARRPELQGGEHSSGCEERQANQRWDDAINRQQPAR